MGDVRTTWLLREQWRIQLVNSYDCSYVDPIPVMTVLGANSRGGQLALIVGLLYLLITYKNSESKTWFMLR